MYNSTIVAVKFLFPFMTTTVGELSILLVNTTVRKSCATYALNKFSVIRACNCPTVAK